MKLYFTPGACSLAPHIVLREIGLKFDLEQVDLKTKTTKEGADFFAVSAKGQVPVLRLDSGDLLTEGPAIMQWIADQNPRAGLAPAAGSMARYRVIEWLNFVTAEIHKTFSPLFNPATPDAYKPMAKEKLAKQFALLDRHLAGKQYLMGDRFTIADAYCFTIVGWAKYQDIDLAQWPDLAAYMGRVAARPKVQEAMKAEGLVN